MVTKMHSLPHPASLLREDVLPVLGLTVTEAARQLGILRSALSGRINARSAINMRIATHPANWILRPVNATRLKMHFHCELWQKTTMICHRLPRSELF